MGRYIELKFDAEDQIYREMLIAFLAEAGYAGFEDGTDFLKAYIKEEEFNPAHLKSIIRLQNIKYTESIIEDINWNQIWEAGFDPVIIEDFVGIRAEFHRPIAGVRHEIIITPKMSFGTGHHATTWLMMRAMKEISFEDRALADFGTGTGILAILACKMGAGQILAIDNDEWCIRHAAENIALNNCQKIQLLKSDIFLAEKSWDIIVSNIGRNVILENMPSMCASLRKGGSLILSGLLQDDENQVMESAQANGLLKLAGWQRNNWICLTFTSS